MNITIEKYFWIRKRNFSGDLRNILASALRTSLPKYPPAMKRLSAPVRLPYLDPVAGCCAVSGSARPGKIDQIESAATARAWLLFAIVVNILEKTRNNCENILLTQIVCRNYVDVTGSHSRYVRRQALTFCPASPLFLPGQSPVNLFRTRRLMR
jgi:hypothetical protein